MVAFRGAGLTAAESSIGCHSPSSQSPRRTHTTTLNCPFFLLVQGPLLTWTWRTSHPNWPLPSHRGWGDETRRRTSR